MIKQEVKIANPYNVIIEDSLDKIGKYTKEVVTGNVILIVTDSKVGPLYLDSVKTSLINEGYKVLSLVINEGEENKNLNNYIKILECLLENKLTRQDGLLSLGGGVISDLAGFAASTYLRGLNHVIVPTTLLSIIDASIGGKTGIDVKEGKNLVGSFYQPKLVFTCLDVLKTLDEKNLYSGLGEGIKYGLLLGGRCFEILESGLNKDNFLEFVSLCISCKIKIVEEDEKESGKRKLLNLGHTFGHAIEMDSEYTLPHGVSVALGIDKILQYSNLSENDTKRVKSILHKYKLDSYKYNDKNLLKYIKLDKKRVKNDSIDIIILDKIGKCRIVTVKIEEL